MSPRAALRSLLVAPALLMVAGAALADPPGPVTACASDTQGGAGLNLAQALAAGGIIRFTCPSGSTIRIGRRYTLTASTRIEGADAVTLDGHGVGGPVLSASKDANVILSHITLRGFSLPRQPLGRLPASVLSTSGDAELDHVTVETSDLPIHIGGNGTVRDSAFVGNRNGFALVIDGTGFVERTRFTANFQGLSIGAGRIKTCDFTGHTAGAVLITLPSGPVEVRHSTFTTTRGGAALALSQRAGRNGPQKVTVRDNIFRDNDGGSRGGAIDLFDVVKQAREFGLSDTVIRALAARPPAGFALAYNRFINNRGGSGGAIAAVLAHAGPMTSTGDLFVGNVAVRDGGAVAVSGGVVRIEHALFKANHAGAHGAAVAVAPDATVTLANTLVVGNVGPAGTIHGNAVTLANVTVADNQAAGLQLASPAARVSNVLLSHNRPADCAGVPAGAFRGGALQSDGSCAGVASGEAFLDAFYVPAPGSPALRAGDAATCRGADVRGADLPFQRRLDPKACALGAFEGPPIRKLSARSDRRVAHADRRDDFSDDDRYQPPPVVPSRTGAQP